MTGKLLGTSDPESEMPSEMKARKVYCAPVLIKLDSLRDITMANSGGGAQDGGMGSMNGTKRGGNWE